MMSVVNVLKSQRFQQVTKFIKYGYLNIAEADLIEIEAYHAAHEHEFTTEENTLINQAIEICWEKIEEKRNSAARSIPDGMQVNGKE